MTNRKNTKRALLTSALAILMCVAMLIGTTFAWFTDTASTAVNKIQAGTLDVQLVDADGNDLEGKTLDFKKAAGASADEKILWEPGCTYELPAVYVKNNGNLALKYKIVLSGINGDAKLNEAIEWTISDAALDSEHKLAVGATSEALTIKGHMKEDAGNEYQGLSIDGIAITVVATQDTVEYDSYNNTYDADAEYVMRSATITSESDGKTTTLESGKSYTVGNATVTVDDIGNISYTNNGAGQTVSIMTNGGSLTVDAPNDIVYHYGESDFVDVRKIAGNSFHEFAETAVLKLSEGRVIIEGGNNVSVLQITPTEASVIPVVAVPQGTTLETKLQVETDKSVELDVIDNSGEKIEEESFVIPAAGTTVEGEIPAELAEVLAGGSVKPEAVKSYPVTIGATPYESFSEAISAVKSGETVKLLNDIEVTTYYGINGERRVILDLNGHNITVNAEMFMYVYNGSLELTGKGKITKPDKYDYRVIDLYGTNDPNAQDYSTLVVGKDVTIIGDECVRVTYTGNDNTCEYGIKLIVNGTLVATNKCINFDWEFVKTEGNVPEITLSETSVLESKSQGIYAAGYGIWNLAGDIITTSTSTSEGFSTSGNALIFKNGIVNITGGTYKSTDAKNDPAEGPQGVNKNSGAAICLVSDEVDGSPKKLKVNISGGTFISENSYGLLECISKSTGGIYDTSKIYANNMDAAKSYTELTITGGTFQGAAGAIKLNDMADKESVVSGGTTDDNGAYVISATSYTVK